MATVGPIWLRLQHKGKDAMWRFSQQKLTIDGVEVPAWIEQRLLGNSEPDMFVRVELRDGSPRVVQLAYESASDQNEVRQKHLRSVDVDRLATDLLAAWIGHQFANSLGPRDQRKSAQRAAIKFLEHQRLPRERRAINDALLKKVADVYRKNISRAPTKAVAESFGVRDRMASAYVERARKAGHLPPTKQGKKQA